ncbi:MAG: hypothetical protein R3200_16460 [Xanthomonadales bacterium]|nr:hypothetical protein [Xanthomonadales bacterium]
MIDPRRCICLWSGPRNVSTALLYAFGERADFEAVDEPLYAHYLRVSGAEHPGHDVVLSAMDRDGPRVIEEVMLAPLEKPYRFIKSMAHHLVELDWAFLDRMTNVLLTRDPREVLPTLSVQIPEPRLRDAGYAVQVDLLRREQARGVDPLVLDARLLLEDPAGVLASLCERLGIPFLPEMLNWEAGPKPYDGVWAPYWYHNVHKSTGFMPYRPKTEPLDPDLQPLLERCRPLYEELLAHAIR